MNRKALLVTTLVAGLGLANAHATLLVRELFDGLTPSLNGAGDSTTSLGFEPGSVWVANRTDSIKVADNFNVDPAVTNQMPFRLTANGGVWWQAPSSGQWATDWWATRQLASGAPLNMAAEGVYYITFNMRRRDDSALGFGFASGSDPSSQFLSVGTTWNNTSFNPPANRKLVVAQGTLNVGQGPYGANAYSTTEVANDGRNLVLIKITTSAGGNDTVQAAFFTSSRAGYTVLPGDEASIVWDVTYTYADDNNYTHLLLYVNGPASSNELDSYRLATSYFDVVNILPVITAQSAWLPAGTVYAGVPVSISVTASGGYPFTLAYQWWKGSSTVQDATNATFSLTNPVVGDSGDYYVVVTNAYGSVASITNTLTILPANPPIFTADITPLAPNRFVGGYVTFSAGIDGTPPFAYQWKHAGTNLPGATNLTVSLTDLGPAQAGEYSLYVTNGFGWSNTATATLTLLSPAPGSYEEMIVTNKPIAYYRLNEGAYVGDLPAVAYEYMGGNDAYHTNTSTADGTRPPAYPGMEDTNNAANYNGAAASSTTVSLMNNLSQFTLMGWFNPALWPQLTPTNSSRVALFGQNDAGEFGFHGQYTVGMWTPGGGYVSFDATTLISANNWYFITAIGNGSNVTFYLNGNQAAQASQTTTNYGSSSYPFRIGYGVLDAGANEFNGLIDEVVLFNRALSVEQVNALYAKAAGLTPPSIIVQPVGDTRYVSRSKTFTVTATGTLPLSYQWRHNSSPISGATTNVLALTNLTAADSGTYDVVVTNVAGSASSDEVTLGVITPAAGSYEENVIGLSPVAYFRLNEPLGSSAVHDYWGGFNGTVSPGATLGSAGPVNPPLPGFESSNTALTVYNGTADSWVTCPAFNLNTNTVTISAWVYADGSQGGWRGIVFSRAGNTTAGIHCGNGNELRYTWNDADDTWGWDSGLQIPTGEWCFVAAVIEPAQATLYVGTSTSLKSATRAATHAVEGFDGTTSIGRDPGFGTDRIWNGLVDEVIICNRALSAAEVLALYQNATALEFKLALTPGGLIEDSKPSGTLHHGRNAGATWRDSYTDFAPTPVTRTGVEQFFAATGSQIAVPASTDFDSVSGTICFWMLASAPIPEPGSEGAILFDRRTTTGTVIALNDAGAIFWQGQGNAANSFATGYLPDGNWHHVAVTYGQAVNDAITVYLDGAWSASVTVTNAWSWPTAQPIELGRSHDTYWKRFDGLMDDVRVYNRVLTETEIGQVYASDALVDASALVLRYDFGTAAGAGQTVNWPIGTLMSSPALGPSAVWAPVSGATPPKHSFVPTESSLFFRAVY